MSRKAVPAALCRALEDFEPPERVAEASLKSLKQPEVDPELNLWLAHWGRGGRTLDRPDSRQLRTRYLREAAQARVSGRMMHAERSFLVARMLGTTPGDILQAEALAKAGTPELATASPDRVEPLLDVPQQRADSVSSRALKKLLERTADAFRSNRLLDARMLAADANDRGVPVLIVLRSLQNGPEHVWHHLQDLDRSPQRELPGFGRSASRAG